MIFLRNQECFGQKIKRYTNGMDRAITQIGAGKWTNLKFILE